jgi:para-aminobenzoate synthetase component I
MEIIGELEPVRRGIYTGAIGWLGYNDTVKLNIAIRTLVAAGGSVSVQSGAGIVADSDPEREYEESLNKARALWLAVERAEAEVHTRAVPT